MVLAVGGTAMDPRSRQAPPGSDRICVLATTVAALVLLLQPASGLAQIDSVARPEAASGDSLRPSHQKSEAVAVLLSTGSLVLPVASGALLMSHAGGSNQDFTGMALGGVGLLYGPSAGYFYGGCPGRGMKGAAIRGGILAVTHAVMLATPPVDGPDIDIVIGGAGLTLVALHGLYESFTVGRCVRDQPRAGREVGLWVFPGSGSRSMMVAVRLAY
jgi:hypothetical protein